MATLDCPLIAVAGTLVIVGPVELAPDDTTYRYIVIRDKAGVLHDFTMVRAVPELSELVERNASGMFAFSDTAAECRLWCVARADGQKAVDFEALHALAMS
jgi:hypothetical protein